MKTKTMSALLRAVLLAAGALLAVFFFLFLPFYGTDTVRAAPEFAWAYWPCLVWALFEISGGSLFRGRRPIPGLVPVLAPDLRGHQGHSAL